MGIWISFFEPNQEYALSLLFPDDPIPRRAIKETSIFTIHGYPGGAARGA